MTNERPYIINSFFAGIGGFDLGFQRQGFSTALMCEINPFCQNILKRHWPYVALASDITKTTSDDIPFADVWCGGFPCQDISLARASSERLGLKGERSGLFHTFANLVEAHKPRVVLMENVEGLLSSNNGNDLGTIIKRMTELGYAVAWRILNSRYFGVPQSRSRIYICCWHNNLSNAVSSLFEERIIQKPSNPRTGFITPIDFNGSYPQVPEVAYCLAASSGRHTGTDWSRTYVVCKNGVRRLTPMESERLQGFPDNWTLPFNLDVAEEDIDTLRYTAIGNAVSVPVIEYIADRIKRLLNECNTDSAFSNLIKSNPNFSKYSVIDNTTLKNGFDNHDIKFKWPSAGAAFEETLLTATVPPCPSENIYSNLLNLIEETDKKRYYLSPNAAAGILRRVDKQKRTLYQPLRKALEKLSKSIAI